MAGRFLVCALILCGACSPPSDGGGRRPRVAISDSAGITRIRHAAAPVGATGLAFADSPSLTIGHASGDPDYILFGVAGVRRLSDGRIVVADGGSSELRFYDPAGRFLSRSGGAGEGPGEFRRMSALFRLPGDTLVVADDALCRWQVFDPDGSFERTVRTNSTGAGCARGARLAGFIAGSRPVARVGSPAWAEGGAGVRRPPAAVVVFGVRGGDADTVARVAGAEQVVRGTPDGGFSMEVFTFGAYPEVAAAGSTIAVIDAAEPRVDLYDAGGRLRHRVTIERTERPVTPALLDAYASDQMAHWPPGMSDASRAAFRERIRTGPHAVHLPQLRAVDLDAAGRIWLEDYPIPGTGDVTFLVLSADGRRLSRVPAPAGLDRGTHPSTAPGVDIGRDYFLGVWRDAQGVESVRMYRIGEPGPAEGRPGSGR